MTLLLTTNWGLFVSTHVLLLQTFCTVSSAKGGEQRIVNGSTVNPPHKYPFMVSIWWDGCFVEEENGDAVSCAPAGGGNRCGGSVLNKHWIITAGHCIFVTPDDQRPHPEHLFIITGLHDREKLEPWSQNLSIAEWRLHEDYQLNPYLINDIALIRVNGTILFSDKVTPVNLPSCDFEVKKDGEIMGTTIGWGINGSKPLPRELQELNVPFFTLETCQRVYGVYELLIGPPGDQTPVNDTAVVTDSMVCAGGLDGAGTCGYDSGSPLVILDQATQTYTVVGLDSFGSGRPCGRAGYPTVYTATSKYLNWINSQVQSCSPRIT